MTIKLKFGHPETYGDTNLWCRFWGIIFWKGDHAHSFGYQITGVNK